MPKPTILIASHSYDAATYEPVASALRRRKCEVLTYEADKVAHGALGFNIEVSNLQALAVTYNNHTISSDTIAAAWYRRPTTFSYELHDKARQFMLDRERRALQYAVWDILPEHCWLNTPRHLLYAEHKLVQLSAARSVGFDIPPTMITNQWQSIHESLPEQILFKSTYSRLYIENEPRMVWATPLTNSPETLPTTSLPFPGIWQPYFDKAREWRITIVGEQTFDAAIYTDADAKDDWARHQFGSSVRFERGDFPAAEKKKCFAFLRQFGLRFGAFDFIETKEGQIIFLECNPNGQYGWLEDELNVPISDAIADELAAIARAR